MQHALEVAKPHVSQIELAVDCRNHPAFDFIKQLDLQFAVAVLFTLRFSFDDQVQVNEKPTKAARCDNRCGSTRWVPRERALDLLRSSLSHVVEFHLV